MLVVDASVLADALLDDGDAGDRASKALAADDQWAAPSHLFVEVMAVIRGRLLVQKATLERADDATTALSEIAIDKIDPAQLVPRIWELRGTITAYDAAYVTAAELMSCPLLTGDRRLSRACGPRCEIHVVHDE